MIRISLALLSSLIVPLFLFSGCQGGASTPLDPAAMSPTSTDLGLPRIAGGTVQAALAVYELTLDPATLKGSSRLVTTREAQQAEVYNLAIANFMRSDTLRVTAVSESAETIDVTYTTTHPFPQANNLGGPPSAQNREDLAVTGRVLWLLDDPDPLPYFSGTDNIRANTRLVREAAGYFAPGDLFPTPAHTANAFPYHLLVDEAADNRIGLSNGGIPTGNFGPQGWQIAEFQNGITGYGIWGQGQASTHTLRLDKSELTASGPVVVRAVILVKYEDPRGGSSGIEKRGNRLPSDDPARFTYRMPHGALDVEHLAFLGEEGGFAVGQPSFANLHVRVRDWDARATEAATVALAGNPDPSLVSQGASGLPEIVIDIPSIADSLGDPLTISDDDTAFGGDVEPDSGVAGDELYATGTISGTPSTAGPVTGLIRATDITDLAPPVGWGAVRIDLDPTLTPLGTAREGAVYQAVTVDVTMAGMPPTASWSFTGGIQTVPGTGNISIDLTTPTLDPSNTTGGYTVEVTWGDGSPVGIFPENIASGPRQYTHPYTYAGTPPNPELHTVSVHLIDDDTPALNGPATPPADPIVTVNPVVVGNGWAKRYGGSTLDFGFAVAVGTDGSVITVGGAFSSVDFGGGLRTNGGASDPFILKLDAAGNYVWDRVFPGAENDFFRAVAVDSAGNVYAHGEFNGTLDFGGGPLTSSGAQDGVLLKLNSAGVHQWSQRYGGGGSETSTGALVDTGGNIVITGYSYSGAISFGGPPTAFSPHYLVRFTPAGVWDMQYTINAGGASTADLAETPTGGYVLAGSHSIYVGGTNFGGGPRPAAGPPGTDFYFVGLTNSGTWLWDYTGGSAAGTDSAQAVAVTSTGTVFGAGNFTGTVDFGGTMRTASGTQDMFLVTLNSSGVQTAIQTFGGTGGDWAYGLSTDSLDAVRFVGSLAGTTNFGGGTVSGGLFLVEFDDAGVWQWEHVFGSSGQLRDVQSGPGNTVYVTGDFTGSADFEPGPGSTILTSAGSIDACVMKVLPGGTW